MGIYELLPFSDSMLQLVTEHPDLNKVSAQGMKEGMTTLRLPGTQKVGAGQTSVAEVMRVAPSTQSGA